MRYASCRKRIQQKTSKTLGVKESNSQSPRRTAIHCTLLYTLQAQEFGLEIPRKQNCLRRHSKSGRDYAGNHPSVLMFDDGLAPA